MKGSWKVRIKGFAKCRKGRLRTCGSKGRSGVWDPPSMDFSALTNLGYPKPKPYKIAGYDPSVMGHSPSNYC